MEALKNILNFLLENYPIVIWGMGGGAVTFLFLGIKEKAKEAKTKAEDAHKKIDDLPCKEHRDLIIEQKLEIRDLGTKMDVLGVAVEQQGESIRGLDVKFEKKFEQQDESIRNLDVKFEKRFEKVDESIRDLDVKFEQRFEKVDESIRDLDVKFEQKFEQQGESIRKLDVKFEKLDAKLVARVEKVEFAVGFMGKQFEGGVAQAL